MAADEGGRNSEAVQAQLQDVADAMGVAKDDLSDFKQEIVTSFDELRDEMKAGFARLDDENAKYRDIRLTIEKFLNFPQSLGRNTTTRTVLEDKPAALLLEKSLQIIFVVPLTQGHPISLNKS